MTETPKKVPTPKRRRRLFKLILVCVGLAAGLLIVEGIGSYGLKRLKRRKPALPAEVAATIRGAKRAVETVPDPYLMYRVTRDLDVGYGRTNAFGLRNDAISELPEPDTYRVLLLGGSVAWGYNARDNSESLSALLAKSLSGMLGDGRSVPPALAGKRVEVLNGGVFAYVSWQGVLSYLRHHRRLRPHAIVTIDGANEVYASIRTRHAGYPMHFDPDKKTYGEKKPSIGGQLKEWGAYRAENMKITKFFRKLKPRALADWRPAPAEAVAREYRAALELLADVASIDGAALMAVLQPMVILPDSKPLTSYESEIIEGYDAKVPGQNAYYEECFGLFRTMFVDLGKARPDATWVDATKMFADESGLVFCDDCHFSLFGRERLAAFLADRLLTVIAAKDIDRAAGKRPRPTKP